MNEEIKIIKEQEVLGKGFKIYGNFEEPLFKASDVASWIEHTDLSRMVDLVDENEKLKRTMYVSGQNRNVWFLTEDGLYEVLMQSRKPIAKKFKKEVKIILKSIRKNGVYMTDKTIEKALNEPDFLIELATRLKQEKEKRMQLEKEKQQMLPKVDYYERVLDSSSDFTITDLSKENEMTARQLNIILTQEGVQFKQGRRYFLKKDFQDRGLTHTRTYDYENSKGEITTKHSLVWTEKGREFINELLEDI